MSTLNTINWPYVANSAMQILEWGLGAAFVSQLIIFMVVWVILGLNPRKVAHEIVHDNNGAVGALFFGISLIVALGVSFYTFDGLSPENNIPQFLTWLIPGLFLASVITWFMIWGTCYWFACAPNLHGLPHERESVRRFVIREIEEDGNVGLVLYIIGLALPPFLATLALAISS